MTTGTPWPELDELLGLDGPRVVGLVARRGRREEQAGRELAVHAAVTGTRVLLVADRGPELERPFLNTIGGPHPAVADVDQAVRAVRPGLVVVEGWPRFHGGTPIDTAYITTDQPAAGQGRGA